MRHCAHLLQRPPAPRGPCAAPGDSPQRHRGQSQHRDPEPPGPGLREEDKAGQRGGTGCAHGWLLREVAAARPERAGSPGPLGEGAAFGPEPKGWAAPEPFQANQSSASFWGAARGVGGGGSASTWSAPHGLCNLTSPAAAGRCALPHDRCKRSVYLLTYLWGYLT